MLHCYDETKVGIVFFSLCLELDTSGTIDWSADILFFFFFFCYFLSIFYYFYFIFFYFCLAFSLFFLTKQKRMKRIKHEYVDKKSEFQQIFPGTRERFVTVVYFDLVELAYAHTFTLLHIFDFYTNGVYRGRRTIDLSLFLN